MTNIRDVAYLAGVSVATVSRFLNQKGYISDKSTKKIQKAIEELDYKPNLIARSLSTKQDNTIGLLLPDITNPFFPELARAIEDVCIEKGYSIILCNTDNNIEKEKNYIELLQQKYVAGLIITMNHLSNEVYAKLNVPIVGLDRVQNIPFPIVTTENEYGGMLAAKKFITTGSRNLLVLAGPETVESAVMRVKGFTQFASQYKEVKVKVVTSYFNFKKTYEEVLKILQEQDQIDGIFACSDTDGIAAIKAATTLNYKIPKQLQVIGFDGVSLGEVTSPSLTTVAQNIYTMGKIAAEQLIAQIDGAEVEKNPIKISPQLIERESTRKE